MIKFYPGYASQYRENKYGEKVRWIFVSNRLAKFIDRKGFNWFFPYFNLKRFTMFGGYYSAVMMSTNGSVLLIKNREDPHFRQIDELSELMDLFINKNKNLSFIDLITFSEKHGLNLDVKFK